MVVEPEDSDPDTAEDAEKRIKGLQAELSRRKGNAEKVEQLQSELAYMKGQLDTLTKSKGTTNELSDVISKMDEETLLERKDQWTEELASLRGKFDRAEEQGDTEQMQNLGSRIAHARKIMKAIQTEDRTRSETKRTQHEQKSTEAETVKAELTGMFTTVTELHPEFLDENSDLWNAGQEQFNAYPILMEKLGGAAQVVAAALAIVKHPELVSQQSSTEVRKEVLHNIDKGLSKALSVGTRLTPGRTTATPNIAVDTAENLAAFNRMVEKVKGN